jgi:hypothetical protein
VVTTHKIEERALVIRACEIHSERKRAMTTPTTPSDQNPNTEQPIVDDILDEDLGGVSGGGWPY